MPAVSSARESVTGAVLCAALAIALALQQPDLRPVMPEVDGVHPVRALQALRDAFVPGRGFLDKYPPLGSWLFGLAAAAGDSRELSAQADAITSEPPAARRVRLWALRDEVQAALVRERWLSRLAAGGAAALVFLLARRLGGAAAARGRWAWAAHAAPLFAAGAFATSGTPSVYAGSVNVDALALLPVLLALQWLLSARWALAGAALALAVALKDPHAVLAPVLLAGAALLGGRRALLRAGAAATAVYAVASGALTAPGTWWEHLRVTAGGMDPVTGVDPVDPASWGRLLAHVGWLLGEGGGGLELAAGGVLALPVLLRRDRREALVVLGLLLAPIVLLVLPVGYAYARFLLVPQALLAVCLGAAGARAAAAAESGDPPRLSPVAWVLLAAVALLHLPGRDVPPPGADARVRVVAALEALAPAGGRVLLFADEREHGPPLDPSRWELDVRGLDEVLPVLAALRERPAAERPGFVLVMTFPDEAPSGAPRAQEPTPAEGERVAGMYVVSEVLGAEEPGWIRRAIAVAPRITLLVREDS